ncbi:MAG TPA: glycosyltransferase [Bryobacteraceae bacterium]|nr:glycosyltransferase [Bryobacteraceae bacterium]
MPEHRSSASSTERIVVLIPLFNDWDAADLLLDRLDAAFVKSPASVEALLVDDGSTEDTPSGFAQRRFNALRSIDVLRLRRNLGHQRAIAVGLVYVYENRPCEAVVLMDGDGEDRPEDIQRLLERYHAGGPSAIVFAARSKRLERLPFRVLYHLYRVIHRLLTGDPVRVGNFSVVPFECLRRLVVVPEIWNHYAAAVIRSRIQFSSMPIARGARIAGESKMNFIALLLHGLSAFFVYGDIVGARLLIAIALALILEVILIAIGIGVRVSASPSVVSVAAYLAGLLGIILLQAIPIALILVFSVIGSRVNVGFLPLRDCPYFVNRVTRIFPAAAAAVLSV